MNPLQRVTRFAWRVARNAIAASPAQSLLFRQEALAKEFGRSDSAYAVDVFLHHLGMFSRSGHGVPKRILEIGPGANVGSALLYACLWGETASTVVLWDRFQNVDVRGVKWPRLARSVLEELEGRRATLPVQVPMGELERELEKTARGARLPPIRYVVGPQELLRNLGVTFDFVYSQAALEHVWEIDELYSILAALTAPGGIHSHHIDLCDHGRRDINFLEMCEWSDSEWWITQRFVPGAINRWRAVEHLQSLRRSGFEIIDTERTTAASLPVLRADLSRRFRDLSEMELRTRELDVIARRPSGDMRSMAS